jgi:ATP-dependent Lon protease
LKEKLLAAHRAGIFEVVIPKENEKDLPDVPENLRSAMKIHLVDTMDEVLAIALERALPTVSTADETPLIAPVPPQTGEQPTAHQ